MSAYNLRHIFVPGELADVSTASSVRIPITDDMEGEISEVKTVLGGAITVADATVTVSVNSTSIGTITVAFSGSAEGDIDSLESTNAARFVVKDDYIKIATNGGSTTAQPLGFVVTIKR